MSDITKIKVDGEPESSYKLFPKNREFEKRAGGNGGSQSGVQSDWNQNDDTQPDFVKNRPFYTGDPVKTEIIPETTVTFSERSGIMTAAWPESFDLVDGQTYTISWDGTDYVCKGILFNGALPALGNLGISHLGDDTGEPFIFLNQSQWIVASTESATEHIISISVVASEVVKIDEKYLPVSTDDSYGVVKKSDIVSAYNFPMMAPHDRMVDAITTFNTGSASIVWDGKKVIMAYYDSSADTISITFAQEPLKLNTYKNVDGFYRKTLGTAIYGELQGNLMRIGNDNTVYTTLATEGTSGHETLNVSAEKILMRRSELSSNALILVSSTENSSKRFKITVDDSGALTATEVT